MKNRYKSCKKYNESNIHSSNEALRSNSKKILKSNKWRIIYNRRTKKYKVVDKYIEGHVSLKEYLFYVVLNTAIPLELGMAASIVACSILALYCKFLTDKTKDPYIEQWHNSGENIIVLRGFNHKHLKYLEREAKFAAIGKHVICQWYRGPVILALSVFGRKEEIEDIFYGLRRLR